MPTILRLFPNHCQKLEVLKHASHIDLDFAFLKDYRFRKELDGLRLAHGAAAQSRVAVIGVAGLLAVAWP
jgi:hypothetical protein